MAKLSHYLIWLSIGLLSAVAAGAQEVSDSAVNEKPPRPEIYSSTMFYSEEVARIDIIIEALRNREELPEETADEKIESAPPAPVANTVYTFPQFHLNSIVYHGPGQWTVWINGRKMTSAQPKVLPGVTIDRVTRDRIRLAYSYAGDSQIRFRPNADDARIEADQFNQNVSVILETNQTFSLYNWNIYEGMVRPVTRIIKPNEDSDADLSALNQDRN